MHSWVQCNSHSVQSLGSCTLIFCLSQGCQFGFWWCNGCGPSLGSPRARLWALLGFVAGLITEHAESLIEPVLSLIGVKLPILFEFVQMLGSPSWFVTFQVEWWRGVLGVPKRGIFVQFAWQCLGNSMGVGRHFEHPYPHPHPYEWVYSEVYSRNGNIKCNSSSWHEVWYVLTLTCAAPDIG